MKKQFISDPMDFHYKEGNAVDFAKTFDLTGNDNDQMLRVYLKRAGLSDNIECLTPEQRKAFIYDIVKSNKNPGYWKPSVLPPMSPNATVRSVHNSAEPSTPDSIDCIDDIPPASLSVDFQHFSQLNASQATSNGEETSEVLVHSPLYERQFDNQQAPKIYNVPPTPPSPSTVVNRKGLKIDISGPKNFVHVSGDMTRDMTKNAFDLSGQFDDKCLKKYMIERGITEEDVRGMDKKDLIKKIIQSRYTWVPIRQQYNGSYIPPPPSETYRAPSPTAPPRHKHHSKGGALIVPPPTLPPSHSNESLYSEILAQESSETATLRRPKNPPPVAPIAIVKNSHNHKPQAPPPPPPPPNQPQAAEMNTSTGLHFTSNGSNNIPPPPPPMPTPNVLGTPKPIPNENLNSKGGVPTPPPPPPPPPPQPPVTNMFTSDGAPPPPPPPPIMSSTSGAPPPPPLPLSAGLPSTTISTAIKTDESGDSRGALLESIRAGVALKKVNKSIQVKTSSGTVKLQATTQPKTPSTQTEAPSKPIKPEQPDFMSELRNATLKRIKKLENNPYADASESQC